MCSKKHLSDRFHAHSAIHPHLPKQSAQTEGGPDQKMYFLRRYVDVFLIILKSSQRDVHTAFYAKVRHASKTGALNKGGIL
jgi:hypothetical protein